MSDVELLYASSAYVFGAFIYTLYLIWKERKEK